MFAMNHLVPHAPPRPEARSAREISLRSRRSARAEEAARGLAENVEEPGPRRRGPGLVTWTRRWSGRAASGAQPERAAAR